MSKLLAMLNPKSISVDYIPGGWGSVTMSDICAAMSGLPELESRYAMHSYVYTPESYEDYTVLHDLHLLHKLLTKRLQNYLSVRQAKAQKLSTLQIFMIRDGSTCTNCRGQKEYRDANGMKHKCYVCDASGYMSYTDSQLSRIIETHPQNWERDYNQAHSEACKLIASMRKHINNYIQHKLFYDERE